MYIYIYIYMYTYIYTLYHDFLHAYSNDNKKHYRLYFIDSQI